MNKYIEPKQNIHVERPTKGRNPQYLSITVSDSEHRDLVNEFSDASFIERLTASQDKIINDAATYGYIIISKCYDVEEVAQFFEGINKG